MRKAVILGHTASIIEQFNVENIKILQGLGYEVLVLANFQKPGTISLERAKEFKLYLEKLEVKVFDIPIERNPFKLKNITAFKNILNIFKKEKPYLVHCHSPIGGILGRLAAKVQKCDKIIYTAHGFHFFKGGSKVNWLVYYPIEKLFSYITDILITINKEDYHLARKRFGQKQIFHMNGAGVNVERVVAKLPEREKLRTQFNFSIDDYVLLSVGELNDNKNHQVIIKAMSELNDDRIKYVIVGHGNKLKDLKNLVLNLGLEKNVFFEGYRFNIANYYAIADVFCFPSKREGLGIAAVEAMACGIPLLTSDTRGINDYSENKVTGYKYLFNDEKGFARGINKLKDTNLRKQYGENCKRKSKKYAQENINKVMRDIYSEL